ncbi:MAG TPA: UvrD-helicase domain-containing protein, partial [Verrucomicrobiae bacterium]
MESAPAKVDSLTPTQQRAVAARGNVLVMAGAGTGKTKTLVARCLDCLARERAALDELLIVTFTEAAAAELRRRLRRELEKKSAAEPDDEHWPRQLARFDLAHIGTLHSFCLKLIREHFYELGLDPQLAILDEGEARQLASETLDEQFQSHYEGDDEFSVAVQNLIQIHGGGRDEKIRALILRLHHYSQTRPDAVGWLAAQIKKFSATEPTDWQRWLLEAIENWRDEWLPVLESLKNGNEKSAELTGVLLRLPKSFSRQQAADVLGQIISADGNWPAKRKTVLRKPLEHLFDEAVFLRSLATVKDGNDPLTEDWSWVRGHMETLLRLAQEFAARFAERKRADGVLDFHDLEQFALKLLWNFSADKPASVAETWREKLRFVFVDEYQDINAAQDKIIAALSRDGAEANRFLVGDVKQSIYRFRLADPKIFRDYAKNWRAETGRVIPLAENFRSRESLLNLTNLVFGLLMREEIGGVEYN